MPLEKLVAVMALETLGIMLAALMPAMLVPRKLMVLGLNALVVLEVVLVR